MSADLSEPTTEDRPARTYVGMRATVTMSTIDQVASRLVAETVDWAVRHGAMRGAPLIRYLVIDMDRELEIEVGVPVEPDVDLAGGPALHLGVLPAGRYLTAVHTGPYDGLVDATGLFRSRAGELGLEFDMQVGDRGEIWASRLEEYLTNPEEQPDLDKHQTLLAFKLAD